MKIIEETENDFNINVLGILSGKKWKNTNKRKVYRAEIM